MLKEKHKRASTANAQQISTHTLELSLMSDARGSENLGLPVNPNPKI